MSMMDTAPAQGAPAPGGPPVSMGQRMGGAPQPAAPAGKSDGTGFPPIGKDDPAPFVSNHTLKFILENAVMLGAFRVHRQILTPQQKLNLTQAWHGLAMAGKAGSAQPPVQPESGGAGPPQPGAASPGASAGPAPQPPQPGM